MMYKEIITKKNVHMKGLKKKAVGVLLTAAVLLSGCGADGGSVDSGAADGGSGDSALGAGTQGESEVPEIDTGNPTEDFYVSQEQRLILPAADIGEQGWREGVVLEGDQIYVFYQPATGLDTIKKWYRIPADEIFTDTFLTGAYPVVTTQEAAVELPPVGNMDVVARYADGGNMAVYAEFANAFFADKNGSLYVLTYETGEENRYKLYQCDGEGQVLKQWDLAEALAEFEMSWSYLNSLMAYFGAVDGVGNIYLTYRNANELPSRPEGTTADRIWVISGEGQLLNTVPLEGREVTALVSGADGVVYGADSGNAVFAVNGEAGTLEEVLTVQESAGGLCLATEAEGRLLYADEAALYLCDPAAGTVEQLLLWKELGISGKDVCAVDRLSDGSLLVFDKDGYLFSLTKVDVETIPEDRQKVVLGVISAGDDLKAAVREFNQRNYYYVVEIKEYGWENGRQLLQNEIVQGKGPDMVSIDAIYVDELLHKGLLADMSPYLEDGQGLEREDLVESVLRCNTIDGVLTCIPASFYIDTLMGRASLLGQEPGWTLEQYRACVEANRGNEVTEGRVFSFSESDSRAIIPLLVLWGDINAFVNWETGTAGFDNAEFQAILQLAADYRSNARNLSNDASMITTLERVQDGSVLLYYNSIGSVTDYLEVQAAFGGDMVFIGYPTVDGRPYSGVGSRDAYAILADSTVKDGAWAFQEFLLTAENGESIKVGEGAYIINRGFPTRVKALEYLLKKAMIKEYQRGELGDILLDASGNPVEEPKYRRNRWDVYAATPEDVEQFMSLIDSLSFANTWYGNTIGDIVEEEILMCMSGDRSVEATIDVIQNRVQLYLDENY